MLSVAARTLELGAPRDDCGVCSSSGRFFSLHIRGDNLEAVGCVLLRVLFSGESLRRACCECLCDGCGELSICCGSIVAAHSIASQRPSAVDGDWVAQYVLVEWERCGFRFFLLSCVTLCVDRNFSYVCDEANCTLSVVSTVSSLTRVAHGIVICERL